MALMTLVLIYSRTLEANFIYLSYNVIITVTFSLKYLSIEKKRCERKFIERYLCLFAVWYDTNSKIDK